MEKNISSAKEKGIKAGAICFAAFIIPYLAVLFYFYIGGVLLRLTLYDIVEIGIFIVASVFVGFSFSRNSKILKAISVILAATVFIIVILQSLFIMTFTWS